MKKFSIIIGLFSLVATVIGGLLFVENGEFDYKKK